MRREVRLSISSHPLADLGRQIENPCHRIALLTCAVPLIVPNDRFFVPALRVQSRRAQAAVKAGRRAGLASPSMQSSGANARRENAKPYPCCLTLKSETTASVRAVIACVRGHASREE